jgi:hypothetical protein
VEYIQADIVNESAVAEEEQMIFESHMREETQALKIVVTNQHPKYIINDVEITQLKGTITINHSKVPHAE